MFVQQVGVRSEWRMCLSLRRKDPLTRKELLEALENRVCVCTYSPRVGPRRTVQITLMAEYLAKLDNRPIGFESTREAALFDAHSINALDIDSNEWLTIEVNSIQTFQIP